MIEVCELHSDSTGADDRHGGRDVIHEHSFCAGKDLFAIGFESGQHPCTCAGRDHDILCGNCLLCTIGSRDLDRVLPRERAVTLDRLYFILAEEILDTLHNTI